MDTRGKTILVTGATGQQGSAAVRHLLEDGWKLRALVHHEGTPETRSLKERGVQVFPGDLLDKDSLYRAAEGVYGVYSMQTAAGVGAEGEETEGKNIAEVAQAADVQHFVYSSVAGADSDRGPDWIMAKHHIEEAIGDLHLPATVWRPVLFMENYMRHRDDIITGRLQTPLNPDSLVHYIAVDDIGRFVALAFRDPGRFIGTTMTIAGDTLTMDEVAQTFSRVLGINVQLEHLEQPGAPTPQAPDEAQRIAFEHEVEESRKLLPDLVTLETWIEATGWKARVAH